AGLDILLAARADAHGHDVGLGGDDLGPERHEAIAARLEATELIEHEESCGRLAGEIAGPELEAAFGAGLENVGRSLRVVAFGPRPFVGMAKDAEEIVTRALVWILAFAREREQ